MSRRPLRIVLGLGLLLLVAAVMAVGGGKQVARAAGPAAAPTAVTPPPARAFASMAYDAANGTVVLFGGLGGGDLNDTWVWDGSTWSQTNAPCTIACPGARDSASMAYTSSGGLFLGAGLLLFGGEFGASILGDTWFWNGSAWALVSTSGPPPRTDASMAYDAANGTTVLFGGSSASGVLLNDTWVWDGSTWSQAIMPASPPVREDASMAYDAASGAASGAVLLFGGHGAGASSLNDTWAWNGARWFPAVSAGCTSACPNGPSARYSASMAEDPVTRTIVLFGGCCSSIYLNDTWIWSGSGWSQRQPAVSPPPRFAASMAEDGVSRTLVLFGGFNTAVQNDTWLWDGSTWSATCGVSTTPASPPCVLGLSPSFGPPAGGTSVTLSGSGFTGAAAVSFGQAAAISFSVTNDTTMVATAPPGTAGTSVDVSVETAADISRPTSADQFTYAIAPTVTGISPANGATGGGTTVTITGTNFSPVAGQTTVQFGTNQAQIASEGCRVSGVGCRADAATLSPQSSVLSPSSVVSPRLGSASVACASSTLCYAIAPPGSGTVDVRVTAFGLQSAVSAADQFIYALAPAVSAVSPRAGPTSGGGAVSISGSGFLNATSVTFGGAAATSFAVSSDTSLTAAPPAGTLGSVVDVRVTTAVGTSLIGAADSFTYVLRGDANANGVVDAVDALCILRQVAKLPGTQACPMPLQGNADVNGDGQVTAVDALCVLRLVATLPTTQACSPPAAGVHSSEAPGPALSPESSVPGPGGRPPVQLGVQPAELHGTADRSTRVLLTADAGSAGLGAWTIDLQYDPKQVQVSACQAEAGGVCNPHYALGVVRVSGASTTGLSGQVTLATLTFQGLSTHPPQAEGVSSGAATGIGTSALTVTAVTLADSRGEPLLETGGR